MYALIGKIEVCPVCGGQDCARRLGKYRRIVIDENGQEGVLVVPRFVCRGLGPVRGRARTFSVLPFDVIPSRRWSVSWLLKVSVLLSDSLVSAMDWLSEKGFSTESRQLYRWLALIGIVIERLHQHPLEGMSVSPGGRYREIAKEFCRVFDDWQTAVRGPPWSLIRAWMDVSGALLMAVRLS